ncbi:hypothetical protein M2122_002304 [Polynucleobacter sphagniphilus]|nr:hypothetical protein [Polynucleobacter sphagniphilus]
MLEIADACLLWCWRLVGNFCNTHINVPVV